MFFHKKTILYALVVSYLCVCNKRSVLNAIHRKTEDKSCLSFIQQLITLPKSGKPVVNQIYEVDLVDNLAMRWNDSGVALRSLTLDNYKYEIYTKYDDQPNVWNRDLYTLDSLLLNCLIFVLIAAFDIIYGICFAKNISFKIKIDKKSETLSFHKHKLSISKDVWGIIGSLLTYVLKYIFNENWKENHMHEFDGLYKRTFAKNIRSKNGSYFHIFGLSGLRNISMCVYPTSMDRYFDDIAKDNATKRDLMKYEWARYESFRNFPKTSVMMPMRLAQAGFFYNGLGEEVTCFCCRVRNRIWNSDETALQVHERISQKCRFIRGDENNNISIHDSDELKQISGNSYSYKTRYTDTCPEGACGGPADDQCTKSSKPNFEIRQCTETEKSAACTQRSNVISSRIQHPSNEYTQQESELQNTSERQNGTNSTPANNNLTPNRINDLPGINYDRAKHPDYAVKSVRMSSYVGWSINYIQKPEELSEAGFYFAGFQDCVRCFFCGGGLKNWVYGDSPWIEHARWYPNCDYVRHFKGEEFVQMYRDDKSENKETEKVAESQKNTTGNNGTTAGNGKKPETTNKSNGKIRHTVDEDMNSVAAETIIEMGFVRAVVHGAIQQYKNRNGNKALTAVALMEIILEDNQAAASTGNTEQACPPVSPVTQSNNNAIQTNSSSGITSENNTSRACIATANIPLTGETKSQAAKRSTNSSIGDVKSLVEENRSLREQMMCKICMDNDACIVFLPCGHMVACPECAPALRKCAICRQLIKGTIRAFPS